MFTDWLENFRGKKTRELYRFGMQKFVEQKTGEKPEDIDPEDIDDFLKEYLDGLEKKKDFMGDFRDYIGEMRDDGLAPKTIRSYMSGAKQFFEEKTDYKIEDKELKRIIKRQQVPTARPVSRDEILTKEQLRKILRHLDSFGRSIVLFLLSSGVRVNEAVQLEVDDLELKKEPPRAYLESEYTKNNHPRMVFFTNEAKEYIEEWLEIRKDLNKRVPPYLQNGDPERESFDTSRIWNTTTGTVRRRWNLALKKAGLDKKDRQTDRYIYHLHTLRKFFRSKANLDKDTKEELLGHSSELDRAYRRIDESEKAEKYKEAESSLSIYERENNKEEILETALAVMGESKETIAEQLNTMGYTHSETDKPYTPENLLSEDLDTIRERMRERNTWVESEPNLNDQLKEDLETYKTIEELENKNVSEEIIEREREKLNRPDLIEELIGDLESETETIYKTDDDGNLYGKEEEKD